MAFKHNYINTRGEKPLVTEIQELELVPNYADGTLWTKRVGGSLAIALGERAYGFWEYPNLSSSFIDHSVVIPNAEKIKYRLIDQNTVVVNGSFVFTGFTFDEWHTVFTLPANIANKLQGDSYGLGKILDFSTSSVRAVIDIAGNVRVNIGRSNLTSTQVQRVFLQITGRLF